MKLTPLIPVAGYRKQIKPMKRRKALPSLIEAEAIGRDKKKSFIKGEIEQIIKPKQIKTNLEEVIDKPESRMKNHLGEETVKENKNLTSEKRDNTRNTNLEVTITTEVEEITEEIGETGEEEDTTIITTTTIIETGNIDRRMKRMMEQVKQIQVTEVTDSMIEMIIIVMVTMEIGIIIETEMTTTIETEMTTTTETEMKITTETGKITTTETGRITTIEMEEETTTETGMTTITETGIRTTVEIGKITIEIMITITGIEMITTIEIITIMLNLVEKNPKKRQGYKQKLRQKYRLRRQLNKYNQRVEGAGPKQQSTSLIAK